MTRQSIEVKSGGATRGREEPSASGWSYRPRLDIVEDGDEFTVHADMPGTTNEGIEVQFDHGTLSIHGRVVPRQKRDIEFLTHEFGVGDFDRELVLSDVIEPDRITAEYQKGVLTVHLPKAEHAKPRRIPVRAV